MSGPAWIVDPNRIATKIKSASGAYDAGKVEWKSNPSKSCPNCEFVMDNTDVAQAWPGLPRGVKFDPSDQEIIWHLLAKAGDKNLRPHPFIDEFIPTVDEDDGICYTHPQNLPGVKQDGSVSHFFHRAIKAYNTGTRKRRKIHGDDSGDVRWHKTGRTKPVLLNGVQNGCKKIMVLYVSPTRGGKAEKTNWVMHQYHMGTEEDEKEGEYVLSKVFYQQQQQTKLIERSEEDNPESIHATIAKVDPVTPKSVDPEPRAERGFSDYEALGDCTFPSIEHIDEGIMEDVIETTASEQSNDQDQINVENLADQVGDENADDAAEENKWWENESQFLLSSQQLVEGLSICDEFLQSQSPNGNGPANGQEQNNQPRLADYAHLGPEDLKRDLVECQNLPSNPPNVDQNLPSDPPNSDQNLPSDLADIDLDTAPEFRLSQLEFESQDSYIAWGGSCQGGRVLD